MSDDEYVDEEYLIYAELCDNADPNIFKHAESSFSSFALDSDQPLLIIGGQAFVGTYKDTVGTAVFLEETQQESEDRIDVGNEPPDPLFVNSPSKILQYVAHTRKTLEMSRVLLIEKNKQSEETKEQKQEKELKEISVDIDDRVQNGDVEEYPENVEEKESTINVTSGEVESLDGSDVKEKETETIPLWRGDSSLMLDDGEMVEDIEQMTISSELSSLNLL